MNRSKTFFRATGIALLISAAAASPAWAASHQGGHGAHGDHGKPMAQAAAGDMTDGEVRKVDKEGGKLTLKHADIKSLDMPAMTMVFVGQGQGDARQAQGRRQDQVQGHQRRGQVHRHRDADGTVSGVGPARDGPGLRRCLEPDARSDKTLLQGHDFKNIRTCIAWTAATLCGGALAASHIVDIAWAPDGRFAHKAQIAAGKFVEVCGKLAVGDGVRWSFDASAPVDFNIHYHVGKEVVSRPSRRRSPMADDTLTRHLAQDYCWMWTNKGSAPVSLSRPGALNRPAAAGASIRSPGDVPAPVATRRSCRC